MLHPVPPRHGSACRDRCRPAAPSLLVALALVLTTGAPLAAQQPRRPDPAADSGRGPQPAQAVAPVVVTTTRGTPQVVGGAATLVVEPDSIVLPPLPTLEQALRALPFVLVRQNSRGEAELSVRGSDSRQAAVLLDGVPLTLGWDHRSDPSLLPLTGAARLSLTRGLATLTAGPNVLGGVLEVDVATPDEETPGDAGIVQARLASGVDAVAGHALGGSVAAARPLAGGRLTIRAGAGWRDRDGVPRPAALHETTPANASDPDLRVNSDLRLADGFAAARWTSPDGTFAGLTLAGYDADRGVPPELHLAEPRRWRQPLARRMVTALSAGTGPRQVLGGLTSVRAGLGLTSGESRIERYADADYHTVAGTELGDEHTTTARLLVEHAPGSTVQLRLAGTLADVRYREQVDDDPTLRYRQRLWSGAAEATWTPAAFGGAELGGGVAWDAADTPASGDKPATGRMDAWGWRLGALLPLHGTWLQAHASASRRARFPALRELYSGALGRFEPNPSLRPETLTALETGLTARGPRHAFQASLFHQRLDDVIVRETTASGRLRRVNQNAQRTNGVELWAEWLPLPALTVGGDLMLQRPRIVDPTSESTVHAEHQPELRAALDLGIALPLALRATVRAQHTGRQWCTSPEADAQIRLGTSTVWSAGLSRDFRVRRASSLLSLLRVTLAGDNLGDAVAYDQCGLPRPGRLVRLGMELG